ncbi:MAG: NAD(P)-dependent alcohol dehydrogenase [Planctomycetaceae bacterium]|jgi:uncharacterized zinc-type alcohol dehydrogenase-like protein|nr:NAD(P)-dependent alcohol dehydrogenase [Planctomycetaceae bacterium]
MSIKLFLPALAFAAALTGTASAQHQHGTASKDVVSKGYAAVKPEWKFTPYQFQRRSVGDDDVLLEILYAGICHTDLHIVAEHWSKGIFPMVPGHEILGRVTQTGKNVKKLKVGDYAGVGCMVNSCRRCEHCLNGDEQYCPKLVPTYNGLDTDGTPTMGGYSNNIVVTEHFAVKVPPDAPMEKVAPLLCAGVTTFSPLKYNNVQTGSKVAVAGFGGLGHMAVQYAAAMGADVTVFDVTEEKRQAAKEMGAVKYVNSRNKNEFQGFDDSFNLIISTIPVKYDADAYVRMLKVDGTMVILGIPPSDQMPTLRIDSLLGRRKVYGSLIGGIKETQETIDFSVKHNIYPHVEIIPIQKLDEAFQNIAAGKFQFRYVIDMRSCP